MLDPVVFLGLHTAHAHATSALCPIRVDRQPLDVAAVGDGDDHLLVGNQLFHVDLALNRTDRGAAIVGELGLDRLELFDDHLRHAALVGKDAA